MKDPNDVALLGEMSLDKDPLVTAARKACDSDAIVMLREVHDKSSFELLRLETEQMQAETAYLMRRALHRLRVRNPIGCFGIHCNSRRSIAQEVRQISIEAENLLESENSKEADLRPIRGEKESEEP